MTLTWADRKAVGDLHEQRVKRELQQRSWAVDLFGDFLSESARAALAGTDSDMRHLPDFVASFGKEIRMVDAKACTRSDSHFYMINQKRFEAQRLIAAQYRIGLFYVFDDLGVIGVYDVGRLARFLRSPSEYLVIERSYGTYIDRVFGSPSQSASDALAA